MRTYPETDYDWKDAKELGVEGWQLEALRMNPDYVWWGPHEDCMIDGKGWSKSVEVESWSEFEWTLDDLNEVVNFYFEIHRESEGCPDCSGDGYNPETGQISDDFYDFDNTGHKWAHTITQDELDVLWEKGRLFQWKEKPTIEAVNQSNHHDAINRGILIETRTRRLGVYGLCETCGGDGSVYVEPSCHLALVLWVIHPRKGASRGTEVKHIDREQLDNVVKWLMSAADRNEQRFGRLNERA